MNIEELKKPLSPDAVSTRKEGYGSVSYIEGHYAINKANEIFGFGSWNQIITELRLVNQCVTPTEKGDRNDVAYLCVSKVEAHGCTYEDVGYGGGFDYKDAGKAHESAAKEAVTDSLKRCLRHFGDQFGNSLYDKTNPLHKNGNNNNNSTKKKGW